jgi:hypothetical protein
MGLYKDHVLNTTEDGEDGPSQGDVKRALDDVTMHIKNENRQKDFAAHWEMNDDSPATEKNASKLTGNQQKALKTMGANWGHYEESPENRGIKTSGNGMGARKGTDASWTLFGDAPEETKKENTGIKTRGNGMGGRKGTGGGFDWDF